MPATARDRIVRSAGRLFRSGERPTVDAVAREARVSRATFYREFSSRAQLLEALSLSPDPSSDERILEAALDRLAERGLASLSMDEVADDAGVSRATLYRLYPGKSALFTGIVRSRLPVEAVTSLVSERFDEAPETVMPELARLLTKTFGSRPGLVRAVFFEVASMEPEAAEAAQTIAGTLVGALSLYIANQIRLGNLRQVHPLLALQSFVGPILFHVVTRPVAEKLLGLEADLDTAVTVLVDNWLRAMKPQ